MLAKSPFATCIALLSNSVHSFLTGSALLSTTGTIAECAPLRLFGPQRVGPRTVSLADWADGFHPKVAASSLFMFFTSIAPAITFAAVLVDATKENGVSQLGPVEVLLSTALTGVIFSCIGGQPLCIVGVTGPVSIFTIACFNVSRALGLWYPAR